MGEKIELRGGWYEFIGDSEPDVPEEEEMFFLPVTVINKMSVYCRYNDTTTPQ